MPNYESIPIYGRLAADLQKPGDLGPKPTNSAELVDVWVNRAISTGLITSPHILLEAVRLARYHALISRENQEPNSYQTYSLRNLVALMDDEIDITQYRHLNRRLVDSSQIADPTTPNLSEHPLLKKNAVQTTIFQEFDSEILDYISASVADDEPSAQRVVSRIANDFLINPNSIHSFEHSLASAQSLIGNGKTEWHTRLKRLKEETSKSYSQEFSERAINHYLQEDNAQRNVSESENRVAAIADKSPRDRHFVVENVFAQKNELIRIRESWIKQLQLHLHQSGSENGFAAAVSRRSLKLFLNRLYTADRQGVTLLMRALNDIAFAALSTNDEITQIQAARILAFGSNILTAESHEGRAILRSLLYDDEQQLGRCLDYWDSTKLLIEKIINARSEKDPEEAAAFDALLLDFKKIVHSSFITKLIGDETPEQIREHLADFKTQLQSTNDGHTRLILMHIIDLCEKTLRLKLDAKTSPQLPTNKLGERTIAIMNIYIQTINPEITNIGTDPQGGLDFPQYLLFQRRPLRVLMKMNNDRSSESGRIVNMPDGTTHLIIGLPEYPNINIRDAVGVGLAIALRDYGSPKNPIMTDKDEIVSALEYVRPWQKIAAQAIALDRQHQAQIQALADPSICQRQLHPNGHLIAIAPDSILGKYGIRKVHIGPSYRPRPPEKPGQTTDITVYQNPIVYIQIGRFQIPLKLTSKGNLVHFDGDKIEITPDAQLFWDTVITSYLHYIRMMITPARNDLSTSNKSQIGFRRPRQDHPVLLPEGKSPTESQKKYIFARYGVDIDEINQDRNPEDRLFTYHKEDEQRIIGEGLRMSTEPIETFASRTTKDLDELIEESNS